MSHYDGITSDGLLLLARNRFEDSKEFYEAHKAQLKQLVLTPMAQIVEALADDLSKLDPQMLLVPGRMISRIRRDTRFTKEKHFYRENVWITFARRSEGMQICPCMWFEIQPEKGEWNAGVCIYDAMPAYMQFLRPRMESDAKHFLKAAEQAIAAGAELRSDPFKKDRAPDASPELKPYLNAKSFHFIYTSYDMALLAQSDFPDILRKIYTAYMPMYRWLLRTAEDYLAQTE